MCARRPGRIDRLIEVALPDFEDRLAILKHATERMELGPSVDLDVMAGWVELSQMSGAALTGVCRDAAFQALRARMDTDRAAEQLAVLRSFFDRKVAPGEGTANPLNAVDNPSLLVGMGELRPSQSPSSMATTTATTAMLTAAAAERPPVANQQPLSASAWADLCLDLQKRYGESPLSLRDDQQQRRRHRSHQQQSAVGDGPIYVEMRHFECVCNRH